MALLALHMLSNSHQHWPMNCINLHLATQWNLHQLQARPCRTIVRTQQQQENMPGTSGNHFEYYQVWQASVIPVLDSHHSEYGGHQQGTGRKRPRSGHPLCAMAFGDGTSQTR
jgi:hypothetical protein